ncbi:MAG: class I SAM-dependent methyltransferase [Alphaproteobacteria bacterium]|nr:class I SAM-dependent methyltransferase [Alphaproteobacteria bacterium]
MDLDHQHRMDHVYRHMKYIYDATRPLFLAGRRTVRGLVQAEAGARVLEVGCGTGRNLIVLARRWPQAQFIGLDISREMISYARERVEQAGLSQRIKLVECELADYTTSTGPEPAPFDVVLFSYSLSMIPDWQQVLQSAIPLVKPGEGKLLIADFGACQAWPGPVQRRLYKNLSLFHVFPRPELPEFLAADRRLSVHETQLLGGYGQVLEVRHKPAATTLEKGPQQ